MRRRCAEAGAISLAMTSVRAIWSCSRSVRWACHCSKINRALAVSSTTTAVTSDAMAMRFSNEMPRAPTEGPDACSLMLANVTRPFTATQSTYSGRVPNGSLPDETWRPRLAVERTRLERPLFEVHVLVGEFL